MFCVKICFLEPEPVRAELLWIEPEPIFFTCSWSRKKNIWSQSPGKMVRLRNTDSYQCALLKVVGLSSVVLPHFLSMCATPLITGGGGAFPKPKLHPPPPQSCARPWLLYFLILKNIKINT